MKGYLYENMVKERGYVEVESSNMSICEKTN